ncbi:MAG: hypothetical protein AAFU03_17180, partial [Bacteroidota bacterium]
WIYPADGFDLVPKVLAYVKRFVNIDDDQVSLIGHSNGAAGAFNYMVRYPSPFAGFFGFNTRPYNYTGGTFLQNAAHQTFFNVSSDQDYYFPGSAAKTIDSLASSLGAKWTDLAHNGTPHWWIYSQEAAPTMASLLDEVLKVKRQSFPNNIIWLADTLSEGNYNWLTIKAFDFSSPIKPWADTINFTTKDWVSVEDPTIKRDLVRPAFKFPRLWGGVKASYDDNVFKVETSRVQSFRLSLSPTMVDFSHPVEVYVNGKLVVKHQPIYDPDYVARQIKTSSDRKTIWEDFIDVKVK